jgi:hypothetical protein
VINFLAVRAAILVFRGRTYLRRELPYFNPSLDVIGTDPAVDRDPCFSPVDLSVDGPSPPGRYFTRAPGHKCKRKLPNELRVYGMSRTTGLRGYGCCH